MSDRLYFVAGDTIANLATGALVAWICQLIISENWNMLLAMVVGMMVGMILALLFGLLVFYRYFGANEVMVPTMLTGMLSGMVVAMLAVMTPLTAYAALMTGAAVGLISLLFCYYCDYLIRGKGNLVDPEV